MKWFWYSLIGFCLLMCGCRAKDVATEASVSARYLGGTGYARYSALADTSRVLCIGVDKSKLRVVETLRITEYDAESGKPVKETEATRETIQDSDKVVSTEEERRVYEVSVDSTDHFIDVSKMVDEEVREESKGGQESFGKWLGIVLGCFFVGLFVYLMKKFRVN